MISAAVIAVYSNILDSPFLFDDEPYIVKNEFIRTLSNFWPPSGSRYFGYLSFAVNYHVNGLDPAGYHQANIAINILNGILVYSLVKLIFKTPAMRKAEPDPLAAHCTALAAALLFALHPVQTESVTYITQRFASLAALFYLLATVLYLAWRVSTGGGRKWFFLYPVRYFRDIRHEDQGDKLYPAHHHISA